MVRGLRRSRLVSLVRQFVEADSWSASRVFVERHPALLSADADEILADLQAVASARGDSAAAHTFEVHQAAGTVLGERYQRYSGPAADLDTAVRKERSSHLSPGNAA